MNKKFLFLLILLIITNLVSLGFISFQYYQTQKENQYLKKIVLNQKQSKPDISELTLPPDQNLETSPLPSIPKTLPLPKFPKDFDFENPFEEMEKFEKEMNDLFKQLDENFSNHFEINIIPKS